jgi:hypothetical protein
MTTARDLLHTYLESVRDPDTTVGLFAPGRCDRTALPGIHRAR